MMRTTHSPLRVLGLGLACLAATACDEPLEGELPDDEAEPRIAGATDSQEPQTMLIRYWQGPTMRGSATLIAPNVLVSNAHASFGPASGMYIQRGTTTVAGVDPLQVVENLHHPNHVSDGDIYDIALLRLGCNITDIAPAPLNRTAIVNPDIGSTIKEVGYGPSGLNLNDWGTRRSDGGTLSGFSPDWIYVAGINTYTGDSGGSLYGYPSGIFGPGDSGGDPDTVVPVRKLLGIITYGNGQSLRIDRHAAWIDGVVQGWVNPNLPTQPQARPIQQTSAAKFCPQGSTAGHYTIPNPEPGVTYTWTGVNALVVGSGPSVTASPSGGGSFTLKVTASIPQGCARMFNATFVPLTSPCGDDST